MADLVTTLREKVHAVAVEGAAYTALGSVCLYLQGYLVLRFHLTTVGISAELYVLDERYLFAGAKFLLYLLTTLPSLVLLGLLCAGLLVGVLALASRLLPGTTVALGRRGRRLRAWCWHPLRLPLLGNILAVLMVQLVMRECFVFSNLLLAPSLPSSWLGAILRTPSEGLRGVYFAMLVAATALSAWLFWCSRRCGPRPGWSQGLHALLGLLVAVQGVLLPVNYGILIADKTMPRVANLGEQKMAAPEQTAWLVWEGKDHLTYLLRQHRVGQDVRTLVTMPRSEVKRLEVTGYDSILSVLFGEKR